jgi:2,5-diketo-D-gluconate reductase B
MADMPMIETKLLRMPRIGLGTWPMKGMECQGAVESALSLGYRHLDTAEMYGNEEAVGSGLATSGVRRGEVFLTTKLWYDKPNGAAIRRALEASLARLATPYVDLALIHWPSPELDLPDALKGLARIQADGMARAVGVSNFPLGLLRRAVEAEIAPIACLQVECHALLSQQRLLDYLRPRGIALTAYSPLAKGELANQPEMNSIARKHGCTASQVALAWLLAQEGVAMVPKAQAPVRQKENLGALGVRLDAEDLKTIAELPKDRRFVNPSFAPDWAS